MKITDFALIFLGVILPIIIIVYVNVSFTIKAIEEEMYYQKLVDSALADAAVAMKEVESDDPENDYGYSGLIDNRVSINANIAADTFIASLANNLNIKGNETAIGYLKSFIPALIIVDYNGVYTYSMEEFELDGDVALDHVIHPKRYFSYTYGINSDKELIVDNEVIEAKAYTNGFSVHTVELSMDDYISHRYIETTGGRTIENESKNFYIEDSANNDVLVGNRYESEELKQQVISLLNSVKQKVIIDVITKELTTAVNKHNTYARDTGIKYVFSFPYITEEEMYRYVDDIGAIALVQGISVGNKYLNYKSYGSAAIELANRYYVTVPTEDSKYNRNLYHKYNKCPEYLVSNSESLTPKFVYSKQQAASLKASLLNELIGGTSFVEGFYPCPICNP